MRLDARLRASPLGGKRKCNLQHGFKCECPNLELSFPILTSHLLGALLVVYGIIPRLLPC